jgi:tryptophan halogenase
MALQEDRNIDRIAIIGGGTAGYIAAFFVCTNYPDKQINWIYPKENKTIGVGEAIIPYVSEFLKGLGVTPKDIIRECKGSLKLGIKFKNFNDKDFYFPFGGTRKEAMSIMKMMDTLLIPDNIFEYTDISNHFDVNDLVIYLDSLLGNLSNLNVIRDTVKLDELDEDLIIDCTGFGRHIFKDVIDIKDNFFKISHLIPNNKALVYRVEYTDIESQMKPYSTFTAMDKGWVWNIPLKDKIGVGYVHSNKDDVMDEFRMYLKDFFKTDIPIEDINAVPMITGRNKEHLIETDNQVVATIGLSSSFIEPIESTGLYLTVRALHHLGAYIDNDISKEELDDNYNVDYDMALDFIIAHYKYSGMTGAYWDNYKDTPMTPFQTNEYFITSDSWHYVLGGLGADIEGYDISKVYNEMMGTMIDPLEYIKIVKGRPYKDWMQNESNFK